MPEKADSSVSLLFSSSSSSETNDDDVKTQEHEFKAETSRLLDIVTNSLYQEKRCFYGS